MQSTVFVGALEGVRKPDSGRGSGLYRRVPGGKWEHLTNGLPAGVKVLSIEAPKGDTKTVYVGTQMGLFRSTDGGDSFTDLKVPLVEGSGVFSILLHPTDKATLYAGLDGTAVCKTTDGGKTWRKLPTVQPAAAITGCFPVRVLRMALDPNAPDELYCALEVGGFIRSLDGGDTWEDCSHDLVEFAKQPHLKSKILSDNETEGMLDLHALIVNPRKPGQVWIANRMGLFVSDDKGKSWREYGIGKYSKLTYGRDVIVSPHDPAVFLAALSDESRGVKGSLFCTDNGGDTWKRLDHDISIDSTLMKVAVSPGDPSRIYCAARLGQVFGTEDGGATWTEMPMPEGVSDLRAVYCV
jgi:photosystem II stability/assembly factor-like uncharacterized protein